MALKDRKDLHAEILRHDINRVRYETRQKLWYDMRHFGLRRKKLPWPGAADLHFPLADSIINKLKPYYFQQIYSSDLIASFVPREQQNAPDTVSTMMWFDYQIRQKTNLETEIQSTIDNMLMSGLCLLKTYWEPDKEKICYDAIHPLNIRVPSYTKDIQDGAWLVQVIPMSVDDYRSRANYNQDKDFIKTIQGDETSEAGSINFKQATQLREGLTQTNSSDEIFVWEVYEKDAATGRWTVHTYSPRNPNTDIRADYELPYEHGRLPFVPFFTEVTATKGFYSPRGIPESVAAFEASLNKLWNEKHDCLSVYNRPLFRTDQDVPNVVNLRFSPGQILPTGVTPVPMPPPPMSFDAEMIQQRMVAESLVGMPDYGIGQQQNVKDARTATEIQAISGVMSQNVDMRARIFRLSLAELWKQSWALLKQYNYQDLLFYHQEKAGQITPETLQNDYVITPSGSADGINKPLLMQKAVQRKQLFSNDPYINQAELDKSILEVDDPKLIQRLLIDPQLQKQDQMESAGVESLLLDNGLPAVVDPSDDDVTHLQTHLAYLDSAPQRGHQMQPAQVQSHMQHIGAHIQKLSTTNPGAAKQFVALIEQRMKQAQKQGQQQQQQGQAAQAAQMAPGQQPAQPR